MRQRVAFDRRARGVSVELVEQFAHFPDGAALHLLHHPLRLAYAGNLTGQYGGLPYAGHLARQLGGPSRHAQQITQHPPHLPSTCTSMSCAGSPTEPSPARSRPSTGPLDLDVGGTGSVTGGGPVAAYADRHLP